MAKSRRSATRALMRVVVPLSFSFATIAVCVAQTAAPAPTAPVALPQAAVEALNKVSGGVHPGFRANHAKGVLVTGTFTASSEAAGLSKAPHFVAGRTVPVLVRFSNGTGVPNLPDADPNASPHGIAIRFALPKGESTDIVSISANAFPAATPEDFVALLQAIAASGPDAAKPTPIETFVGSHPAALAFVKMPFPPPESFATLAFYGVNAFKFTNAQGRARFVRYQILPEAGEHALTDAQAKQAAPNYLMDELPARLKKGPVRFALWAQVANDGDPVDDGTKVWPADRKRVRLGTLTLKAAAPDQEKQQRALLFNPLSLPAGIEPSNDPVLLFRPAAYGVSFTQRAQ